MTITTDQPVINHEDRPAEPTEPGHLDPPQRSRPTTKTSRTALRWLLGTVAIAAAAVVVAVIVDADGTDTSVNRGVVTERNDDVDTPTGGIASVEGRPTTLDRRGIPIWWSGRDAAPGRITPVEGGPTTLDRRGIPTWWSGREAALDHDDVIDRRDYLPADNFARGRAR